MPSTFDLQSHSLHSDGTLPAADVVARAAAAGMTLMALTDHDTVDGVPEAAEAAARGSGSALSPAAELSAVHGELRGPAHPRLRARSRRPRPRRRAARLPRRPRTAHRPDGRPPARARLRARRRAAGRPPRRRQADRPPPPGRRRARPPGQRGPPRRGGDRRPRRAVPALPGPGRGGVRRPQPADRPAGDRGHPRGRRRRGVGAPVLGPRPHRGDARHALAPSPPPASTASRPSTPPTRPSRPRSCTTPPPSTAS